MSQLPLDAAYAFLRAHGLGAEASAIRASHERFVGVAERRLKSARVLQLLDDHRLLSAFVREKWRDGSKASGKGHVRRLRALGSRYKAGALTPVSEAREPGNIMRKSAASEAARIRAINADDARRRALEASVKVVEYRSERAFVRDRQRMLREGWYVAETSYTPARAGLGRVLALGFVGALVWKPEDRIRVTYYRDRV